MLLKLAVKNKKIKIINLAKNMGKHAAVLAGYQYALGEYIVYLDDDYQSPVNNLWGMFDTLITENYDVVLAKYVEQKQPV